MLSILQSTLLYLLLFGWFINQIKFNFLNQIKPYFLTYIVSPLPNYIAPVYLNAFITPSLNHLLIASTTTIIFPTGWYGIHTNQMFSPLNPRLHYGYDYTNVVEPIWGTSFSYDWGEWTISITLVVPFVDSTSSATI